MISILKNEAVYYLNMKFRYYLLCNLKDICQVMIIGMANIFKAQSITMDEKACIIVINVNKYHRQLQCGINGIFHLFSFPVATPKIKAFVASKSFHALIWKIYFHSHPFHYLLGFSICRIFVIIQKMQAQQNLARLQLKKYL